MTTESKVLAQKLTYDRIAYTRWERFRMWYREVWLALLEKPPTHWSRERIINPGELGYDDPFNMIIVTRRVNYPHWPESTLTAAFTRPLEPDDIVKLAEAEKAVLQKTR